MKRKKQFPKSLLSIRLEISLDIFVSVCYTVGALVNTAIEDTMFLYENLDSVKGKVAEWGSRFGSDGRSFAMDYSDSTKGTSPRFDDTWSKYPVYLEIPVKECELLGCYNCVYAQFSDAYKGCCCGKILLVEGVCARYKEIEPTFKDDASNTSEGKT